MGVQFVYKYLYANGDPVRNIDPSGYFSGNIAEFQIAKTAEAELRAVSIAANLIGISSIISNTRTLAELEEKPERASSELSLGLAKVKVRQCAKGGTAACNAGIPVIVFGSDVGEASKHIFDAQMLKGISPILNRSIRPKSRSFLRSAPECKGLTGGSTGLECDEFPFSSTEEGGRTNYRAGRVSLRPIPASDNSKAGGFLGGFYGTCKVNASDHFQRVFGAFSAPSVSITTPICTR